MFRHKLYLWLKFIRLFLVLGPYLVISWIYRILLFWHPRFLRSVLVRHGSRFARYTLWALGIRVTLENHPLVKSQGTHLIVSNHLSYVDVLVIYAMRPAVFVTSYEVRDAFFLGSMAKGCGSLFVERRKRFGLQDEVGAIAEVLRDGHSVVIFPEGTTSGGEGVLPFKISLLASALEAPADVLPLCVRYQELNGEPFPPDKRDVICYYGRMEFFPHLLGLLETKSMGATLTVLEPIAVRSDSSRKDIAQAAYQVINHCYTGMVPA